MRGAIGEWLDRGPPWVRAVVAVAGIAAVLGALLAVGIVLEWLGLLPEPTTECVSEDFAGQCRVEIPLEPAAPE